MKHNKKRNTAFLYESLIKELTKSVVRKQNDKKVKILKIIKESFFKGSPLFEDLKIYKSILDNVDKMTNDFRDRFLVEIKKDYNKIDRKHVFNAQTKLISQINNHLGSGVFSNFIPNYKEIATVGSWFQGNKMDAKARLIIETKIKALLIPSSPKQEKMKHIDNLTYKTFVQKFNNTYKNSLKENQKNLLTNYIVSFSDNGLGLKSFVNEEISTLKSILEEKISKKEVKHHDRLLKVSQFLESFKSEPLNETMIKKLFYVQDLMEEL